MPDTPPVSRRYGRWLLAVAALVVAVLAVVLLVQGGPGSSSQPWDSQPEVFQVDRLDPTVRTVPLADAQAALLRDEEGSPWLSSLNGDWRFQWAPSLSEASADFMDPATSVSSWDTVQVPHNWQLDGFGDPDNGDLIYLNEAHPWQGYEEIVPPTIPTQGASIGSYRRTFEVPQPWQERRIVLAFAGVKSAFTVWVNGQEVGYSEDSYTPAEFDITDAVTAGENVVAVQVHRWSDGSWLENQDMIDLSGIFRDVELYAVPDVHVDDYTVRTALDEQFRDAVVTADLDIVRYRGSAPADAVRVTLHDAEGGAIGSAGADLEFDDRARAELEIAVADAQLWSAESPYLYTLVVELLDGATVIETLSTAVGIREFEIVDGLMQLNGMPLDIKGMNRGEMHPDLGQAMTEEVMRQDLVMMRQHGITAVRTAHYPAHPTLYRLADEIGMYVMDEANIESHELRPFPGNSPPWAAAVADRVASMFERDKNHPSVLWWSLGNEAAGGQMFADAADWLRAQDPTRLVHYQDDPSVADIEGVFYPLNEQIAQRAAQPGDKPWIMTEYQHAMGNSLGGIEQDWAIVDSAPHLQGGFVWDWADQAIRLPVAGGVDGLPIGPDIDLDQTYFSYGGDWGDYPTDGGFSINGVVLPDRTPQPELEDLAAVYAPLELVDAAPDASRIQVRNEHLFTDLSAFDVSWTREVNGQVVDAGELDAALPPGQTGWIELPVTAPQAPPAGALHTVTVSAALAQDTTWARAGHVVARMQLTPDWGSPAGAALVSPDLPPVELTSTEDSITVTGSDFSVSFDATTGLMREYLASGRELLAQGPQPDFWRAPTQNDVINGLASDTVWRDNSQGLATPEADTGVGITDVQAQQLNEATVRLDISGAIVRFPRSDYTMTIWVLGSGDVVVESSLAPVDTPGEIPLVGTQFTVPGEFDTLTWLGAGPHPTWRDRDAGAVLGRWSSPVADQFFAHVVPQASGNHTDVRWLSLTDASGAGLLISAAGPALEAGALPFSEAAIESARHPYEVEPDGLIHVSVDAAQQGVGVTWLDTALPQFTVNRDQPHTVTYVLSPLVAEQDADALAARVWQEPEG
ncbi:MAG: glycoside hydrolase family 2 TIM barrel-domain containing protein [Beutenbergiaceae bacterium]